MQFPARAWTEESEILTLLFGSAFYQLCESGAAILPLYALYFPTTE